MTAKATNQTRTMPMSNLGPANRYPKFSFQMPSYTIHPDDTLDRHEKEGFFLDGMVPMLPYTPQSTFDRTQQIGEMPTVVLENEHMRATVYPKYGGRLASLFDKKANRELLFDNPVFQPANLAIRHAWFSGGVEWNGPLYGHTLLTCSDVYVARIETDEGEGLRIYEFDRSLETTWQVDLVLDNDSPKLWIHVKVDNVSEKDVDYYWWTNIAVPQTETTRVLSNTLGRAVRHTPDQRVFKVDFPEFDEFDGSYPFKYKRADSIFFDMQKAEQPWIASVEGDGKGTFHTSTKELCGRKFFAWGNNVGGNKWMSFLSEESKGQYLEIQGGLRPTQLQTIPLPSGEAFEWTECIHGVDVNPADTHGTDYTDACKSMNQYVDQAAAEALQKSHAQMTALAQKPVKDNLWQGSPWGHIYTEVSGRPTPKSMQFDAAITNKETPWCTPVGNAFKGSDEIGEYMHSHHWLAYIEKAIEDGQGTWQHHLHLGVAHMEQKNFQKAREQFGLANDKHPSPHAWRNLALIEQEEKQIEHAKLAYTRALELAPTDWELATEYSRIVFNEDGAAAARTLIDGFAPALKEHERIRLLRAEIALAENAFDEMETLLAGEFSTIREGETTLSDLWYTMRYIEEGNKVGRELTEDEKKAYRIENDPPAHLDFRMNLAEEDWVFSGN